MKPFSTSVEVDKSAADEAIDLLLGSERVTLDNVEVVNRYF